MSMIEKISRSFGTHDGTFHADEVTACALLLQADLIDAEKIVRTRSPLLLAGCEFICDVGGMYDPELKLFDHHQVDYEGSMSSAGMVLLYLRETDCIDPATYDLLNHVLVQGVDDHDNGKDVQTPGVATYSHVISNFTPIRHDCTAEEQDVAFYEALKFAWGHVSRIFKRHEYALSCRGIVEQAMKRDSVCLHFEEQIPWLEIFFELGGEHHNAQFMIMPTGTHWKLRGVPPTIQRRMEVRHPLPEEWAGLLDQELKKISGIEGAIFCHKGKFISVWETREDAERALEMVLQQKKKEK